MEQEQEKEIMVGSDFLQLEGTGMTAQAVTIGGKNYAIHAPSILCLQKVGECLALMATVEMNDKTLDEGIRMTKTHWHLQFLTFSRVMIR